VGDATLKRLFEQASQIAVEAQMIADNLERHNPGLVRNPVPLEAIQTKAGKLARELADLYGKIGKKIKYDTILNKDL
jgi:antitoxin component HigA of HigAB toxin-antitoxin module